MALKYLPRVCLPTFRLYLQDFLLIVDRFRLIRKVHKPLSSLQGHFLMACWYPLKVAPLVLLNLLPPTIQYYFWVHLTKSWKSQRLLLHFCNKSCDLQGLTHLKWSSWPTGWQIDHQRPLSFHLSTSAQDLFLSIDRGTPGYFFCTFWVNLFPHYWARGNSWLYLDHYDSIHLIQSIPQYLLCFMFHISKDTSSR